MRRFLAVLAAIVLIPVALHAGWESWTPLSEPADGDLLAVHDVSDTTGDASGTTKHVELSDLWSAYIAPKARTLIGYATGQDDLDTFTGAIIPDDSDIKEALQALESAFADKADKAPAVNTLGSVSSGYLDEVVVAVPITASITRYKFEFDEPLWLDGQYAVGFIATSGTIVRHKADGDVYSGGNGVYGGGSGQWNMTGTSSMDWNVIFEKCKTGETRRSRPSAILF